MRNFKRMQNKEDDSITDAIAFTEGKFSDIIFKISKVDFGEPGTDDELNLHYEYNILRGNPDNVEEFEKEIGDFIIDVLREQVASSEEHRDYAYTGGTD